MNIGNGNQYRLYDQGHGEFVGPEGAVSPNGVAPELSFVPGYTYVFKQLDADFDVYGNGTVIMEAAKNTGHPINITTSATYQTGGGNVSPLQHVVSEGTSGVGREISVTIPDTASPTNLWYVCALHEGMGNTSDIPDMSSNQQPISGTAKTVRGVD